MNSSIKDVAKLAGVSIATVSRVVNGHDNIKDSTKIKVESAMKQLHYVPNTLAKAMRMKKTNFIGVVVAEISDPFFSEIYSLIDAMLKERGYRSVLLNSKDGKALEENENKLAEFVRHWHVDGIIFCYPENYRKWYDLKANLSLDIEAVFFDIYNQEGQFDRVEVDLEGGMYNAVNYYFEQGEKKIGFLGWDGNYLDPRTLGYIKAHKDANIEIDKKLLYICDWSVKGGQVAAEKLISDGNMPSAIIATNDSIACGAMKVFMKYGYKIPDDINIIGCDDDIHATILYPELTTLRIPIEKIAKRLVDMILTKIEKSAEKHMREKLETEFIIRGTTKE